MTRIDKTTLLESLIAADIRAWFRSALLDGPAAVTECSCGSAAST
jgi:hypothetical protein